jgi:uncharacterized membrane protein YoaK (UPF0700 family)
MADPSASPQTLPITAANPAAPTRGLILATSLAGLAGMVDAIGYLQLGHLFVSYMSGNSTLFAIAVGEGDRARACWILALIGFFVVGAAAGQLLSVFTGRRHLSWVLAVVAVLLTTSALAATAAVPMVLAMGVLNASIHRVGNIGVSLTYVTGTLVKFGQGLGNFLARRVPGWEWLLQAAPWVGLVLGATIGGIGHLQIGAAMLWVPVAFAGLLALVSLALPEPA